jgi:hypothetical protein
MKNISKQWTACLGRLAGRPCIQHVDNEEDLALRGVYGELYQYSNDGEYYRVIV